ncbi:MAG: flavodoxin family protein [Clostridia bacterium]|nr:flavodoxin family protein [Clostridia bacterium]
MSKVLVITASLRTKSNSDLLAQRLIAGAQDAGHRVEMISLKGKDIQFCKGCLACQKTGKCVIKDDVPAMMEQVKEADTLVFVTPVYYYEMSGQLKTLLDRMNPLYGGDYRFRNVYLLTVAADDDPAAPKRAESGLTGWIDCFERATLAGTLFCGGINDPGEAATRGNDQLKAYTFGKQLR